MIDELIVKQLRIDSNKNSDNDFEVDINDKDGVLVKFAKQTIFRAAPKGIIEMPDCIMYPETMYSNIVITVTAGSTINSAWYNETRCYVNYENSREETIDKPVELENPIRDGFYGTYNGIKINKMSFNTTTSSLGLKEVLKEKNIRLHGASHLFWISYYKYQKNTTRVIFLENDTQIKLVEQIEYFDTSTGFNQREEEVSFDTAVAAQYTDLTEKTIRSDKFLKNSIFKKSIKKTRYAKKTKDMSTWHVI